MFYGERIWLRYNDAQWNIYFTENLRLFIWLPYRQLQTMRDQTMAFLMCSLQSLYLEIIWEFHSWHIVRNVLNNQQDMFRFAWYQIVCHIDAMLHLLSVHLMFIVLCIIYICWHFTVLHDCHLSLHKIILGENSNLLHHSSYFSI